MKTRFISFLRYTERHTKTDMVYLVGQSGWLLIGQTVIFSSSFLLAYVFGNYLEPADYGLYKFVLAVATLATITTVTGMGTALAKSVAEGYQVSILKLLKIRVLFGLIGTIILFGVAVYYLSLGNTLLALMFALTAIWIPFYESLSDYQFILQGKKDFRTQTKYRIIQRLALTLAVISSILLTSNIIAITFVFFSCSALSHLFGVYYTLRKYPTSDDSLTPYQAIISYGKNLSLMNIFLISANQLDKIIMFKLLGSAQLAVYFFAIAIPQELNGVLGNINSVAFPKLVNKESYEFKVALVKKIVVFTLFLFIPVLLYILIAPYLFETFFPKYLGAIFISQLYIGTILFIPASLIWHYFYAVNHKKALRVGTFTGPFILIVGMLLLVPYFSLVGAVLANYARSIADLMIGLYFFFSKRSS